MHRVEAAQNGTVSASGRPLRVNLLGRRKGFGMQRSMALLGSALAAAGCRISFNGLSASVESRVLHNDRRPIRVARRHVAKALSAVRGPLFDVCVHMERVDDGWMGVAPVHCVVPNPEHFGEESVAWLSEMDHVLCKTLHTQEVFSGRGVDTHYIGFTSHDLYRPGIRKTYDTFFHLAGKSPAKGTEALVAVWARHPEWPTLTIVQDPRRAPAIDLPNVEHRTEYLENEALIALQNRHGVHLCPSRVEGFGHYINEAMGCGAVVLTTAAPPMNELVGEDRGVLVDYAHARPIQQGTSYEVDHADLEAKIEGLIQTSAEEKQRLGERARAWFLENDAAFRRRVAAVVRDVLARPMTVPAPPRP